MSSATLHLRTPVEYTLQDGTKFEARKIDVVDYTKEIANEGRINVYGTLHTKDGPRAHKLVIPLNEPVDLETDLRERVREALLAGDFITR